jgi:hypothetical protein
MSNYDSRSEEFSSSTMEPETLNVSMVNPSDLQNWLKTLRCYREHGGGISFYDLVDEQVRYIWQIPQDEEVEKYGYSLEEEWSTGEYEYEEETTTTNLAALDEAWTSPWATNKIEGGDHGFRGGMKYVNEGLEAQERVQTLSREHDGADGTCQHHLTGYYSSDMEGASEMDVHTAIHDILVDPEDNIHSHSITHRRKLGQETYGSNYITELDQECIERLVNDLQYETWDRDMYMDMMVELERCGIYTDDVWDEYEIDSYVKVQVVAKVGSYDNDHIVTVVLLDGASDRNLINRRLIEKYPHLFPRVWYGAFKTKVVFQVGGPDELVCHLEADIVDMSSIDVDVIISGTTLKEQGLLDLLVSECVSEDEMESVVGRDDYETTSVI